MPLRDHFRPPVSDRSSWEAVHGGWPMVIVQQLVRTLPERYIAEPRVHLGAEFKVNIAAYEEVSSYRADANSVATPTTWAATQPTLTLETELADSDEYEVRVYDTRHNRRLVAAVELISPSNKEPSKAQGAICVQVCSIAASKRIGGVGGRGDDPEFQSVCRLAAMG